MNSAIQCLSNTPPLTQYFVDDKWKKEINKKNPIGMNGQVAEEYADLVKELWSGGSGSVMPVDLKRVLGW
jgi:ubiquitin carboxyl-terminal hydrolase 4/11/15